MFLDSPTHTIVKHHWSNNCSIEFAINLVGILQP
uniref:Uncharacterized protein n=1 Tax=Rhizophora mucronata TaxID=61149 RepID=A0A2P2Q9J8_RHIMU